MKRQTATILFILILAIAKLSEPNEPIKSQKPEHEMVWRDGDRVLTADGFMDLPRAEREKLIQKL